MPKLKEVDFLYELANRALVSRVVQCSKEFYWTCAGDSSLIELREAIAAIKATILPRIPLYLKTEFLASLINDCGSFVRDESHGKAILEMIMDIDDVGLRLTGQIVRFLEPDDAPRLKRLKELDLSHVWRNDDDIYSRTSLPVNFDKFHLNDVTLIKYPNLCTDSDLEIIGRNCPNLEVLDLFGSGKITDAGISFLSGCPNLRVLKVDHCPKVTHVSLSFLLSGHKNLKVFSYGYEGGYRPTLGDVPVFVSVKRRRERSPFDMLSGLDFAVQCPSLTRFVYENDRRFRPAVELKSVVTKFPNLTYLRIKCIQVEDLTALIHLKKLTELRVDFDYEFRVDIQERLWLNLKEALTVIGANLTSLTLHHGSPLTQSYVNFVFESCPNLEHLQIDQGEHDVFTLAIPPFPKLRELIICPAASHDESSSSDDVEPILHFGEMFNLEILSLIHMKVDYIFLESIMFDNVKFPKLRLVKTNSVKHEDLEKIEQTARDNNLDFCTPQNEWDLYHLNDWWGYDDFDTGGSPVDGVDFDDDESKFYELFGME